MCTVSKICRVHLVVSFYFLLALTSDFEGPDSTKRERERTNKIFHNTLTELKFIRIILFGNVICTSTHRAEVTQVRGNSKETFESVWETSKYHDLISFTVRDGFVGRDTRIPFGNPAYYASVFHKSF